MKLKTLKDLSWETIGHRVTYFEKELKAEAVKWVKEISKKRDENFGDIVKVNGLPVQCDEYSCDYVEKWIIYFFNLTEDDL